METQWQASTALFLVFILITLKHGAQDTDATSTNLIDMAKKSSPSVPMARIVRYQPIRVQPTRFAEGDCSGSYGGLQ
jgi:hypothetical protein